MPVFGFNQQRWYSVAGLYIHRTMRIVRHRFIAEVRRNRNESAVLEPERIVETKAAVDTYNVTFKPLFKNYRAVYYWYAVLIVMRLLAFSFIAVLLSAYPKAQVVLALTTLFLALTMQLACHPFRDHHVIHVAASQRVNQAPTAGGDFVSPTAESASSSRKPRFVRQQCESYWNQLEMVTLASLCCVLVFGLIYYDNSLQKAGFIPEFPLTMGEAASERRYEAIVFFFHLAMYVTAVVIAHLFMRQMNEQHPHNPIHRLEIRVRDLFGVKRSKERVVLKARAGNRSSSWWRKPLMLLRPQAQAAWI
jgi:hypothetical protein